MNKYSVIYEKEDHSYEYPVSSNPYPMVEFS